MNTLSRIFRAANWKYALGEVALIFAGISLALLANSWYEDSKDRQEEREILRQLVVSLQTDVQALQSIRSRIEEKVRLMTDLESHIRKGLPYSSELDESFRAILTGASARMNTAAFETLKFRGVGLVSNTVLRSQLVDYYDTEQALLDHRNSRDTADIRGAVPYFKEHFRWGSESLLMTPIDYESLVSDQEFLNILSVRIWALSNLALREYSRIINKAEQLNSAIEHHLESLQ
jgi:hypothetical protein